jgi:hypothetical protein
MFGAFKLREHLPIPSLQVAPHSTPHHVRILFFEGIAVGAEEFELVGAALEELLKFGLLVGFDPFVPEPFKCAVNRVPSHKVAGVQLRRCQAQVLPSSGLGAEEPLVQETLSEFVFVFR